MAETKKYYHNLDVDNNKVTHLLLNPLTTAQRTAVGTLLGPLDEGYVCFDTTLNQQYFWDGAAWVTVTATAAWGSITGTLTAQTDLTAYLAANYYPLATNPAGYLTTAAANLLYYPLSSNPAGYLTSETDPVFTAWLATPPNISIFNNDAGYLTSAVVSVGSSLPISSTGGIAPIISISQSSGSSDGYLSSIDWTTFNSKQDAITLTTSGTSGAATFISNVLNIPQYQSVITNPVTGTGTATRVAFWDSSSSISSDSALYWDNVNKRLGIGTATPSKALDVASDALVNGALLGIGPNTGSSFPNTNIVFGTSALAANTTGYYNAAIGTNAMNANTTGYYNLAIGYDALKVNLISRTNIAIGATSLGKFIGDGTVNGGNTGIGALTLRDNVTGLYNTAIGYGSILSVTGSSYNSAIGYSALRYATTAAFNTAIGTYAGSYYGSAGTTTLTTANNGTFIGYYSRPLSNSSTNEIVIGYNSVGNGNDSTTIGNSNTTSTNLFGALGFGATPSYGTSGQVLTSGGTGVAPTWTTPSTSGRILHGIALGTDTYTATIGTATSYTDGDAYLVRFTNGNTSTATLNINGIGAVTLYRNNDGAVLGGDIIAGAEMLCVYDGTTSHFQVIGVAPNTLIAYVTNADSVTITKGQVVYAFGGQGDRMTVKLANNTGDATSAQTVGLVWSTSIASNQKGLIMMQGLLDGLSILPTSTYNDGDPIYLGSTAGSITNVKPYAPNHLVYLGVVTTASPGAAGRMYVRVQNGYELDELHNVQAQSPTVNDVLYYFGGSPGQWKTASLSTILGYTPVASNAAITPGTNLKITYDSKGLVTSGTTASTSDLSDVTAWIDYSATSTIVGFSAYAVKKIQYKKIDAATMIVQFQIESTAGNGSGTATSFTLPFNASSWGTQYFIYHSLNNTTTQAASSCTIAASSNVVNFYPSASASGNWTASTTRHLQGQIIVNIA